MRNNLCPITVHRLMDMKWENIKSLYPSEHRDLLALSLSHKLVVVVVLAYGYNPPLCLSSKRTLMQK
jgi:hypothetical protein